MERTGPTQSGEALPCRLAGYGERFADLDAAATALKDFDVVGIMRERTAFPRALFERLPKLRLMVTTGKRNASIDLGRSLTPQSL